MQPDAIIDGTMVEFKTMNFTLQNNLQNERLHRRSCDLPRGDFTVSGEVTAYFQSAALFEALMGKPHKASIWERVRPHLYRLFVYGAMTLWLSLVFMTEAH